MPTRRNEARARLASCGGRACHRRPRPIHPCISAHLRAPALREAPARAVDAATRGCETGAGCWPESARARGCTPTPHTPRAAGTNVVNGTSLPPLTCLERPRSGTPEGLYGRVGDACTAALLPGAAPKRNS